MKAKKTANSMVSMLYAARGLPEKEKLLLVKTLILPTLTYPCTPLNASSITTFANLQSACHRALKFAFGIRYPAMPTARSLLARAKIKPLNVIIHNRAKRTWDKIERGIAGDQGSFATISAIEIRRPHRWFPSSLERARQEEPPPIYTRLASADPSVRAHYHE